MSEIENDKYVYPGARFSQNGMALGHGQGMTLRDWFAGQALAAMIAKAPFFDRDGEYGSEDVDMLQFKIDMSESAYLYADAMIAAREVTE